MTTLPPHILERYNVSRETLERLEAYVALLLKWNAKINLISKQSEEEVWERHVLDSLQLIEYLSSPIKTITDFGSGAGFPGIILAITGIPEIHLVESDTRKCTFLREASRLCGGKITVHNARIEALTPWKSDVVTARALAPLSQLLEWISPFMEKSSCGIFLKGANVENELREAERHWQFSHQLHPSITAPDGCILTIEKIEKKTYV